MTDTPRLFVGITPHLVCSDAATAIDFYTAAVGAAAALQEAGL